MAHRFGEITIEELPAQHVISCRVISTEPEDDSIRAVQNWLVQHGLPVEGRRSFGFDSPVSPAEAAAGMRGYEIGYVVPEDVKADDGVQNRIYGGSTCAVMRVYNAFEAPFESIPGGWQHLMGWLHNHPEWQPACTLCYEELVNGENGHDLILYEPVKPRK